MTRSSSQPEDETATDIDGGLIQFSREFIDEFRKDDLLGLAAEVAYHAIFALPALLVLILTLAGLINEFTSFNLADQLYDMIDRSAPASTQDILDTLVDSAVESAGSVAAPIGLVTSIFIALWAGSNAIVALMKAFNRAYDTGEQRSFVRRRVVAILLTIVLGVIVNLAFALWVFGGELGSFIASRYDRGDTFDLIWNIARWPAGIFAFMATLSLLYYFGPNVKKRYHLISPGPVVATILWLALVFGFSTYLQFASPGSAYGALSSVIVFLVFLYITAIVFLIGAEVDALVARRHRINAERTALREQQLSADAATVTPTTVTIERPDTEPSWRGLLVGALTTVAVIAVSLLTRRARP